MKRKSFITLLLTVFIAAAMLFGGCGMPEPAPSSKTASQATSSQAKKKTSSKAESKTASKAESKAASKAESKAESKTDAVIIAVDLS